LIGILPLAFGLFMRRSPSISLRETIIRCCAVVLPVCTFSILALHLGQNYLGEASLIHEPLFSINNGLRFTPSFLVSMLWWKWCLVFGILAIIGIFSGWWWRMARPPAVIFLGYLAVYAMHYRGYYAAANSSLVLSPEWAARYFITFMPFLALLAGIGCLASGCFIKRFLRLSNQMIFLLGIILTITLTLISCFYTYKLRAETSAIEQDNRLNPVFKTLRIMDEFMPNGSWLLTTEPQLFYIYGNQYLKVYDIAALPVSTDSETNNILRGYPVLVMEPSDALTRKRYSAQMANVNLKDKHIIYDDLTLRLYAISQWR
ncbi:MAG: hypothetical protein KJ692_03505, partial [Verrucomicrobia bacterium]|nr:hypothetical protein [Verrucomicrobiota bacterium]